MISGDILVEGCHESFSHVVALWIMIIGHWAKGPIELERLPLSGSG